MELNVIFTACLILAGGVTMLVGIIKTGELIRLIPESKYAATWKLLRLFMLIFFTGYMGACIALFMNYDQFIFALTGVIFFLGAVFVLIVVVTGKGTITDLKATLLSKGEKEVMLKEIHHRVKNNLQVIISLLRIQSQYISDEKILSLFEDCENRIMSMALIHEKLYQSRDMANIGVDQYIDLLVRNLMAAYHTKTKLTFETHINVAPLSIDTLIPLGLLLNELISNSLKHAYPNQDIGNLIVTIDKTSENNYRLVMSDDGIGISDELLSQKKRTLGAELITLLVEQLDGTLKRMPGPGTKYEVLFRDIKNKIHHLGT